MTDAVKLLTEAEWREHYKALGVSSLSVVSIIEAHRERGLIAEEPVDALDEIVASFANKRGLGNDDLVGGIRGGAYWSDIRAALKRGMEMRPSLTREMVRESVEENCVVSVTIDTEALHAALTKEQS